MKQILYYKLKACLKRYVFTWHLKFDRESRLDMREETEEHLSSS